MGKSVHLAGLLEVILELVKRLRSPICHTSVCEKPVQGLLNPSLSVTKVIVFCLEHKLFIIAMQYVIKMHWPLTKELQLKIRTPKHLDYKQTQLKNGTEKKTRLIYIFVQYGSIFTIVILFCCYSLQAKVVKNWTLV